MSTNSACVSLWIFKFDVFPDAVHWTAGLRACRQDFRLDRLALRVSKNILKEEGFAALAPFFFELAAWPFKELKSYVAALV